MKNIEITGEEFPVDEVMDTCAKAAWLGEPSKTRKFQSDDGKVQMLFEGTIYEPSYEEFSADCNVFVVEDDEKKPLYTINSRSAGPYKKEVVTTGSKDDVREYILYNDITLKEVL